MIKRKIFYARKIHRWLGVILGIQFMLWTIGGLYFSWSNMDDVHGDLEKNNIPLLASDVSVVSPTIVLGNIKKNHQIDSIVSVQLIEILGKPYYQVRSINNLPHSQTHKHEMIFMNHIANAATGQLREALTKDEAVNVARIRFKGNSKIKNVEYLTTTNGHHEYRESPLPAYAITFENPGQTTVYVASELGTVEKFRNNKWRIFDFLWMMHTMDYQGRDNIGNILLRAFSIFGLVTVISGFVLYFVSSKRFRKTKVLVP